MTEQRSNDIKSIGRYIVNAGNNINLSADPAIVAEQVRKLKQYILDLEDQLWKETLLKKMEEANV